MSYTTKQIGIRTAECCIKDEGVAHEAFYPGQLLQIHSDGTLKKHATASGPVIPVMVAKEDELQGNGVTTAYTAANQAIVWLPQPGAILNFRVANGQSIAIGDYVESAGTGNVQKYVADVESGGDIIRPQQIIGVAKSACDMSGSSEADASPPFVAVLVR